MLLRLFIWLFILFFPFKLFTQNLDVFTNHIFSNYYSLNPAAAGIESGFISQLTYSKKWVGMNESPATLFFGNSVKLGGESFYDENMYLNKPFIDIADRVGLGFTVFNESYGPTQNTGFEFAYAYHLPIHKNNLSFGLSGSLSRYSFNHHQFSPIEEFDPTIYSDIEYKIQPNVNAGFMYYNKNLKLGLSLNKLLSILNIGSEKAQYPASNFLIGYKHYIKSDLSLEPTFITFYSQQNSVQFTLSAVLNWKENWIFLSCDKQLNITSGLGVTILEGARILYGYSFYSNSTASIFNNGHTLSLQLNISKL